MGEHLLWAALSPPLWLLLPVQRESFSPSVLFCLGFKQLVDIIKDRVLDLPLHAWFLDDGTLDQLREVVQILQEEGPRLGLILSTAATVPAPAKPKSTIWCPTPNGEQEDPLGKGLVLVKEKGVVLLGAPLCSATFEAEMIQRKVEKVRDITASLPLLEDPHTEFVLLRSCLSLPKISFLLRAVDASQHALLLQDFDRITREALIRILGAPVDDRTWQQGKLPVSMGGLGLRAAEDHAPAAHAASVLSAQLRVQDLVGGRRAEEGEEGVLQPQLLVALSKAEGEQEQVREADLVGMTQRQMGCNVDLEQQRQLMNMLGEEEEREKARLLSLTMDHAGDWLNTPPLKALGLHLRAPEFVLAIKYRLGMPVFDSAGPCPACLRDSDVHGDHAMCCGAGGERISRHNNLRDALYDTAVAAGLGPVREGRFLLPGTDRRPADVLVPNWVGGKDAALDVTIITPLQAATMPGAANTAGHHDSCPQPRFWPEGEWGRGGMQKAGHCLLAHGGRYLWWLALCCTARG